MPELMGTLVTPPLYTVYRTVSCAHLLTVTLTNTRTPVSRLRCMLHYTGINSSTAGSLSLWTKSSSTPAGWLSRLETLQGP